MPSARVPGHRDCGSPRRSWGSARRRGSGPRRSSPGGRTRRSSACPRTACCPWALGLWQAAQSTARCPPCSGNRVSWCALVIASRSTKLRVVWQRAQSAPNSPRWLSVWQEAQFDSRPLKSSDSWQARQVVAPWAPCSGKPYFPWSNGLRDPGPASSCWTDGRPCTRASARRGASGCAAAPASGAPQQQGQAEQDEASHLDSLPWQLSHFPESGR